MRTRPAPAMSTALDLIAIGRVSVDLYGQQIGSRLEDVSTFAKALGGCPANVAVGVARLGLKPALISRVGDEPMGRFVREQLAREGVETRGVQVDPQRLTSLVLLGVRDEQTFPLIFYLENCADGALCEDDIDEGFLASSRSILITGTHFSLPNAASAQRKAIDAAKAHGARVILDIDYRPNLWGIGGHGAGDAFLAGFLSGYLRDEPHEVSARLANACGALAVSRLLCSPEFPTRAELDHYLAHGSSHRALREDSRLNHLHWATTRRDIPKTLRVLAMEGRSELRQLALRRSVPVERLARLEALAVDAVARVAAGRGGFRVLLDGTHGAAALRDAERARLWLAQPVERPASRPLEFEAASLAAHLEPWPAALTVKCLCLYHPDDRAELRGAQERNLLRLAAACRAQQRELLLEIAAGGHGELEESTTARVLSRLYELGIRPDWWGLEPQPGASAWERCAAVIAANDEYCRGALVCGLDEPPERIARALALAAAVPLVRGLVAGGSILTGGAQAWLAGEKSDETATVEIAARFAALVEVWSTVRDPRLDRAERSAN